MGIYKRCGCGCEVRPPKNWSANLDLDVRGACVRRKKRSQLTPCEFCVNQICINRGVVTWFCLSDDVFSYNCPKSSVANVTLWWVSNIVWTPQPQTPIRLWGWKFMVETSWVEKSRVAMSCKPLESGHFNNRLLNPRLFNHEIFNHIVVWDWGVHGCKVWPKLGLKSLGLGCPATIEVNKEKLPASW